MDDPVAIPPEGIARRAARIDVEPATALCRICGINSLFAPGFDHHRCIDLTGRRT
jgi:hypothetical protein